MAYTVQQAGCGFPVNVSGGFFEISGRDIITTVGYFHTCISRHEINHCLVSILRAQLYAHMR